MDEVLKKAHTGVRKLADRRVIIALLGAFLSVALHELFHVLMHWNDILSVGLFNRPSAIAEVIVLAPHGYDLEGEEIAAYSITLLTMLLTVAIICKIHDKQDQRTFSQIFLTKNSDLQHIAPSELVDLAHRSNLLGTRP